MACCCGGAEPPVTKTKEVGDHPGIVPPDEIIDLPEKERKRLADLKEAHAVVRGPAPVPRPIGTQVFSPVHLNVYHLIASKSNKRYEKVGFGLFHTGVEVFGKEWSFGEAGDPLQESGLFVVSPMQGMSNFYKRLYLGETTLSPEQVDTLLHRMENEWKSKKYHVLHKNCNHFCRYFCKKLSTVTPLVAPKWTNRIANWADVVVPRKLATWAVSKFDNTPPLAVSDEVAQTLKDRENSNVRGMPTSVVPTNWFRHWTIRREPQYTMVASLPVPPSVIDPSDDKISKEEVGKRPANGGRVKMPDFNAGKNPPSKPAVTVKRVKERHDGPASHHDPMAPLDLGEPEIPVATAAVAQEDPTDSPIEVEDGKNFPPPGSIPSPQAAHQKETQSDFMRRASEHASKYEKAEDDEGFSDLALVDDISPARDDSGGPTRTVPPMHRRASTNVSRSIHLQSIELEDTEEMREAVSKIRALFVSEQQRPQPIASPSSSDHASPHSRSASSVTADAPAAGSTHNADRMIASTTFDAAEMSGSDGEDFTNEYPGDGTGSTQRDLPETPSFQSPAVRETIGSPVTPSAFARSSSGPRPAVPLREASPHPDDDDDDENARTAGSLTDLRTVPKDVKGANVDTAGAMTYADTHTQLSALIREGELRAEHGDEDDDEDEVLGASAVPETQSQFEVTTGFENTVGPGTKTTGMDVSDPPTDDDDEEAVFSDPE